MAAEPRGIWPPTRRSCVSCSAASLPERGPDSGTLAGGGQSPGRRPRRLAGAFSLFLAGDGLFTTCTSGRSAPRLILGPLVSARLTPGLTSRPGSSRSGRGGWGKTPPQREAGQRAEGLSRLEPRWTHPASSRLPSSSGRVQRPGGPLGRCVAPGLPHRARCGVQWSHGSCFVWFLATTERCSLPPYHPLCSGKAGGM